MLADLVTGAGDVLIRSGTSSHVIPLWAPALDFVLLVGAAVGAASVAGEHRRRRR